MPKLSKHDDSLKAHAQFWAMRMALGSLMVAPRDILIPTAGKIGSTFATAKINSRGFRRATVNLRTAFPHWTDEEIHYCARSSYDQLLRLGVELNLGERLITPDGWTHRVHVGNVRNELRDLIEGEPVILITAHVGNWEVIGQTVAMLGFPMHALYRKLDLEPLDRWVRKSREKHGLTLIDKFGAVDLMPDIVRKGAPVGFVADQNGGDRGVFVPFFGRLTSTYKSIALLALQFNARILCGMARRVTSSKEIEEYWPDHLRRDHNTTYRFAFEAIDSFGKEDWTTHSDPVFYICARYRRAVETMVRRAPEQYLWMHRIWRSRPLHERKQKPFPDSLRAKLEELPWMESGMIEAVRDRSDRDTVLLAQSGRSRFDEPIPDPV
ncbi:MAG: lysophospholipid acyltransferase family protein [Phycisphaeraceae bacterium]|nr:lysophospholipid acyltransferase family protein [Phycisphaerales bacterium]MCB9859611.1 lysophospholipid acyltransferase family protein [Phycisphaeraceae bacterium]